MPILKIDNVLNDLHNVKNRLFEACIKDELRKMIR